MESAHLNGAIKTVPLFEHLEFQFLSEYDVFTYL